MNCALRQQNLATKTTFFHCGFLQEDNALSNLHPSQIHCILVLLSCLPSPTTSSLTVGSDFYKNDALQCYIKKHYPDSVAIIAKSIMLTTDLTKDLTYIMTK